MNAPDFRSMDVAALLSECSEMRMVSPSCLVDRIEARRNSQDAGLDLPWSKLDGLFKLRGGELVLLGGYTGHFKSTIANQIVLEAAKNGWRSGIASLELPGEDVIESMAEIAATSSRPPMSYVKSFCDWIDPRVTIYDRVDAITPHDAVAMTYWFAENGHKLIILDALMMMGVTEDMERERDFVQMLSTIAKSFGVCIVLVHHMRKPQGYEGEKRIPGKYDFLGAGHLVNTAMSVLICWHDKEKAAEVNAGGHVSDETPDFVLSVAKQRHAKFEGRIGLYQHPISRAFCNSRQRSLTPMEFNNQQRGEAA